MYLYINHKTIIGWFAIVYSSEWWCMLSTTNDQSDVTSPTYELGIGLCILRQVAKEILWSHQQLKSHDGSRQFVYFYVWLLLNHNCIFILFKTSKKEKKNTFRKLRGRQIMFQSICTFVIKETSSPEIPLT